MKKWVLILTAACALACAGSSSRADLCPNGRPATDFPENLAILSYQQSHTTVRRGDVITFRMTGVDLDTCDDGTLVSDAVYANWGEIFNGPNGAIGWQVNPFPIDYEWTNGLYYNLLIPSDAEYGNYYMLSSLVNCDIDTLPCYGDMRAHFAQDSGPEHGWTFCVDDTPGGGDYCQPDVTNFGAGPAPKWDHSRPNDPFTNCCGPDDGDDIDLVIGEQDHQPSPDLVVYNPYGGVPAVFGREYSSYRAEIAVGAVGFTPGWGDNYDYAVVSQPDPVVWNPVQLQSPNGASEDLTPSGTFQPNTTVPLAAPTDAPYSASGTTGASLNQWSSVILTWTDGDRWVLTPTGGAGSNMALTSIQPLVGQALDIHRDGAGRITSVASKNPTAGAPDIPLLSFHYTPLMIVPGGQYLDTVTDMVDPGGRHVTYTVDPSTGALTSVSQVLPAGAANVARWSYQYNTTLQGQGSSSGPTLMDTITVPGPSGSGTSTSRITYDLATGKVTGTTDGEGSQHVYTYVPGKTTVDVKSPAPTSALVQEWVQKIDSQNRDAGVVTDPSATPVSETIVTYPTDAARLPSTVQDELGRTSSFTYDGFGHPTQVTVPNDLGTTTTTTYTYDNANPAYPTGALIEVQEGTKAPERLCYKDPVAPGHPYLPHGEVSQVLTPAPSGSGVPSAAFCDDGGTSSNVVIAGYQYTPLGQVSGSDVPGPTAGSTIHTAYSYGPTELIGEPASLTVGTGPTTETASFNYDPRGNLVTSVDGLGFRTDFAYNLANQRTAVYEPATGQTGCNRTTSVFSYAYPGGPQTGASLYDENTPAALIRSVAYSHGLEGELLGVSGSTVTRSFGYDAAYHRTSESDGNGHTTTYAYHPTNGRLMSVTYPNYGHTTGYAHGDFLEVTGYNADGQPATAIDGNGRTLTYRYSPAGRPAGIAYSSDSSPASSYSVVYDAYNRVTSVQNGAATVSVGGYDDLDEPTSVTTTFAAGGPAARTLSYAYTPSGQRKTLTVSPGIPGSLNGSAFTTGYDAIGRPATLTNPFGEQTSWSYATLGGVMGNPGNGWLKQQTLGNGAYSTYAFNGRGLLTGLTNFNRSGSTLSVFQGDHVRSNDLLYDAAGNLVVENVSGAGSASPGLTTFAYDGLDRLTGETNGRASALTAGYAYDGNSNLTQLGSAWPSIGYNIDDQFNDAPSDAYDGNGNPTTYASKDATHAVTTYGLFYDPANRLTLSTSSYTAAYDGLGRRVKKTDPSGTTTYFVYDGGRPLLELDASGNVLALNTFGANGLVSRTAGGTSAFYEFDPLGNTVARLASDGVTVRSSDLYGAYGTPATGVPTADPFGYEGQWGSYTEPNGTAGKLDLVLMGARYYDPGRGRFLTRDPIGHGGGPNLYGYVGGNPVNAADPSGLSPSAGFWGRYDPEANGQPTIADANPCYRDALLSGLRQSREFLKRAAVDAAINLALMGAGELLGPEAEAAEGGLAEGPAGAAAQPEARGGTYILRDPETGEVMRTGRSGNLKLRQGQHARQYPDLDFEIDRRTDVYFEQRGREQIIHDLHNPPLNRARPINPKNPLRGIYIDAGRRL